LDLVVNMTVIYGLRDILAQSDRSGSKGRKILSALPKAEPLCSRGLVCNMSLPLAGLNAGGGAS
jgi:hypothetical protein